jgi:IS5 family transposase
MTDRAERVVTQIKLRLAGEPIPDRLVSMFDPDARPIRKGKLGKPNEFGYVAQICEVTENTKPGARGFILPAATVLGNPPENTLLPITTGELARLGLRPREVALDGGFQTRATDEALRAWSPSGCSSLAASNQGRGAPGAASRATASAPKAASATSNANTDSTDPASRRTGNARLECLGNRHLQP